jgi:uncharacterized membrane protein YiaA
MNFNNRIWGRGIIAWLNLAVGVLNLAVGLYELNYLSLVNYFIAGLCFSVWCFDAMRYR